MNVAPLIRLPRGLRDALLHLAAREDRFLATTFCQASRTYLATNAGAAPMSASTQPGAASARAIEPRKVPGVTKTETPQPIIQPTNTTDTNESYALLGRFRLAHRTATAKDRPVLDPAALYGVAGDIVSELEPITEATPDPN